MSQTTATLLVKIKTEGEAQLTAASNTIKNTLGDTVTSVRRVDNATKKATTTFGDLGTRAVDIAAKLYLVQVALRNIANAAKEAMVLAELGASVKDQAEDFQRMATQLGAMPDLMSRMSDAAGGLLTDFELQKATVKLLAGEHGEYGRQLANSLPILIEEARALRANNSSLGSMEVVLNAVTKGIDTMTQKGLRLLGITIDSTTAYENYKEKIGATNRELTIEEKKLAFLDAVLAQHNTIMEQAGGTAADATDKYASLTTAFNNTKEGIGSFLDAALAPLLDRMVGAGEDTSDMSDKMRELGDRVANVTKIFMDWADGVVKATTPIVLLLDKYVFHIQEAGKESEYAASGGITELNAAVAEQPNIFQDAIDAQDNYVQKWADTVDKLAEKQAQSNRKIVDAMQDFEAESIDIANDLNDKLQDIQDRAAQDRADAWDKYNENMRESSYNLAQRLQDLAHNLTESFKGEDENYDDRKRDLERRRYETVRDITQKLKELDYDAQHAKTDAEREEIAHRKKLAEQELQDKIEDIEYDLAETKRKHDREKTDIQEKNNWEVAQTKEKIEHEQLLLQEGLNAKLASITATEIEATQKANEESQKRTDKALKDLADTKAKIESDFKMAWLDALQSITPAGSELHNMLEIARLKELGATEQTFKWRDSLMETGRTAAGLQQIFNSIGTTMANQMALMQAYRYASLFFPFGGMRAGGGDVSAGRSYVVGENGPELFTPPGSGTIIPNGGGGGGGTVIVQASGPFMGDAADAIRFGNMLIPIITRALEKTGNNTFARGTRRVS